MLVLELKNIHGQWYNRASNMASVNVRIYKNIKKEATLAGYLHCGGYCLNLIISCFYCLTNLRNAIDKANNVLFNLYSPKYWPLFIF